MRTSTPVRSVTTLPWVTRTSGGPSRCWAMRARISASWRWRRATSLSAPWRGSQDSTRPKASRAVSRHRQRGSTGSRRRRGRAGGRPRRPGAPGPARSRRGSAGSSSRRGARSEGRSRRARSCGEAPRRPRAWRARPTPGPRPTRASPPGSGARTQEPQRRPTTRSIASVRWSRSPFPGLGYTRSDGRAGRLPPRRARLVRAPLPRRAHRAPGARLAGDRRRRRHADRRADRLGQDAGRLPRLHRPAASGRRGREPGEEHGTEVVYVSPLKALAVDIRQNLERPLAEIARGGARRSGCDAARRFAPRVRTGDTTAPARGRRCSASRRTSSSPRPSRSTSW